MPTIESNIKINFRFVLLQCFARDYDQILTVKIACKIVRHFDDKTFRDAGIFQLSRYKQQKSRDYAMRSNWVKGLTT